MSEFEAVYQLKQIRERGPRVTIRIRGLAAHMIAFNRAKIYTDPDSVAATASALAFQPLIESAQPKSFLSRWRGLWRVRNRTN
jgi:hypothetical protein